MLQLSQALEKQKADFEAKQKREMEELLASVGASQQEVMTKLDALMQEKDAAEVERSFLSGFDMNCFTCVFVLNWVVVFVSWRHLPK